MLLGTSDDGPVILTIWERLKSHMHVIGSTQLGKSRLMELMARSDILRGRGITLIDLHGTLYDSILRWMNFLNIRRPVVLVNPSVCDYIKGFNPFAGSLYNPATLGAAVNRRIAALIKPWGMENTNEAPTMERVCRLLFSWAIQNNEPLTHVALLLQFGNAHLRARAISQTEDPMLKAGWTQLQAIKTQKEWDMMTGSTNNRLNRFLSSQTIKRFMGRTEGNLDLGETLESGQIILVNLARSEYLSPEEAKIFASLFLNQLFEAAMKRAGNPKPYILYLDEFQEYATADLAGMLDQVLKTGLHVCMAHQHLGHFVHVPSLRKSIMTNAKLRAAFGGLDNEDSYTIANEVYRGGDDAMSHNVLSLKGMPRQTCRFQKFNEGYDLTVEYVHKFPETPTLQSFIRCLYFGCGAVSAEEVDEMLTADQAEFLKQPEAQEEEHVYDDSYRPTKRRKTE